MLKIFFCSAFITTGGRGEPLLVLAPRATQDSVCPCLCLFSVPVSVSVSVSVSVPVSVPVPVSDSDSLSLSLSLSLSRSLARSLARSRARALSLSLSASFSLSAFLPPCLHFSARAARRTRLAFLDSAAAEQVLRLGFMI